MEPQKSAPERGWPRVGYFLAKARAPRSARQAAVDTKVSLRTIQAYERAEIDYSTITPVMENYARKIAGWTEADILAIYNGGSPPERSEEEARVGLGVPAAPISEETQAQALAAILSLRDVPIKQRKYLASIIESLPVEANDSPEPTEIPHGHNKGMDAG